MSRNWNDYKKTVRSARAALPIALQMEELFPVADHFITDYGLYSGPKTWNTEVFVGGRYILTMQVDVEISYGENQITRVVGLPKFLLKEASKVDMLPDGRAPITFRGENERRFGPEEWNKLYQAKGDFSVIGVKIDPAPVANFEEFVSQTRRDRIPVSLLDK